MSPSAKALTPLLLLLAGAFAAAPPPRGEVIPSPADVYRRTLPGVVWIRTADGAKGTGWVLDRERRLIVTCFHVLGDSDTADVVFPLVRGEGTVAERAYYLEHMPELKKNGQAVAGRVLRRDPHTDLAILQLDSLPSAALALPLGASACPGDRVHAVGCRYDSDVLWVYAAGTVRQVQPLRDGYFNAGRQLGKGARVVLAQAPINEGDSGGPLVNDRGEVVGVTAAVAWEAQGSGLFIDVSHVRALAGLSPAAPDRPGEAVPAREVYQKALRSVALVQATSTDKRAIGFVISRAGKLLVTTADAAGKRDALDVTFPFRRDETLVAEAAFYRDKLDLLKEQKHRVTGVVLAVDVRRNLALVTLAELPADVDELRCRAESPAPGDPLHLVTNPARLEFLWVYTSAHLRQLGRANLGQTSDGPDPAVLLAQAPLPEGEGGGPVLDGQGALVGMVSGKSSPQQQLCFCLAAREIRDFLAESAHLAEPRDAGGRIERAERFVKARQYAGAVAEFSEALGRESRSARALSGRGRAYYLLGEYEKALADCDRALQLDPRLVTAYCHRAAVCCQMRQPARALADCEAALKIDPRSVAALVQRGQAYGLVGEVERGLADCDDALWLDHKSADVYVIRARLHASKDDHAKAIADYTAAWQLEEQRTEALRGRADSYWARSDVTAALADYTQAVAQAPDDVASHRGRGRCLTARGDHPAALAAFNAALRIAPHDGGTYLERARCRLRAGEREQGYVDLGHALRWEPGLVLEVCQEILRSLPPPAAP